ncbi:hypothetical protein GCM10010495_45440 [Kitasatospora herbaricolor]|uniref:hypothetical protein n=1 Tax=Kitasatospora herbaricolor TaxID=68217 RepID=UPI00174B5F27|nr:hypothetical protein [Kitasatospora herbaricolor]MDQ0313021.1 hypothetical protein [Kitasatospora herbaricolor]GGV24724.1 hypothetical protein GCM10010495_45440 [Kitasatospora herbaricolor]
MALQGFGTTQFQLVLLRRMADFNPGLVEEAVRWLGSSRAELREANRRWQAMIRAPRFPRGAGRFTLVLGPPESSRPLRIGDLGCTAQQWALPLWPELRFEVLLGPGSPGGGSGPVLNEWLVRADGSSPPDLRTLADLTPWSCVVSDVAEAFPPAVPREGSAPTRWQLDFAAPDPAGVPCGLTADFTWGLLQEVRAADRP